jgi:formylglycine-generating enzyme required for sulfatase activity
LLGGQIAEGATETRFYRVVAPTSTVITAFTTSGTIAWSNNIVGSTCRIDAVTALHDTNWTHGTEIIVTAVVASVNVFTSGPSAEMSFIRAGAFVMGDVMADGYTAEMPIHTVAVSAFFIGRFEVTKAIWDDVLTWATNRAAAVRYGFDNLGDGKAANHPVQNVFWFDCLKWCNARSEKEGLTPCYTVGGSVYRTGGAYPVCNWSASGYRLPTEAEWEKAARGGAAGRRFPWEETNTIQHARANYSSDRSKPYDNSPTLGYHPTYAIYPMPFTSPVGMFAPNGCGLYDMAGNVAEWCWDAYDAAYYSSSPPEDPRGGSDHSAPGGIVMRGGGWYLFAAHCRVASRSLHQNATYKHNQLGLRVVRKAQ